MNHTSVNRRTRHRPAGQSVSLRPEDSDQAEHWLALAASDRRTAEKQFSRLPVQDQVRIVCAAPVEQRIDLLLLAEHPEELVPSLPEVPLYEAVQTVGKWEAQPILEYASGEQINFMLDHDCWRGERLDSRRFTDWLRLLMACDDSQVYRLLTAVNVDLLAYYLKKHVRFHHDIMVNDTYYCDPSWVEGTNPAVREFLERLYAMDPNLWIRLLAWVRTHSRRTMEADALAGRDSRLQGRGIPPPTLAITIYYPVPENVAEPLLRWFDEFDRSARKHTGQALAAPRREKLFFATVTARMLEKDEFYRHRSEAQLVDIANKVIIADDLDIGDIVLRRQALDKVRRWCNVGLEFAAGGNLEQAEKHLNDHGIEYFFRLAGMLFDLLASAAVQLQNADRASGGRLIAGDLSAAFLALTEAEPKIPVQNGNQHAQRIVTLDEYRYAWQLAWTLAERVGIQERLRNLLEQERRRQNGKIVSAAVRAGVR